MTRILVDKETGEEFEVVRDELWVDLCRVDHVVNIGIRRAVKPTKSLEEEVEEEIKRIDPRFTLKVAPSAIALCRVLEPYLKRIAELEERFKVKPADTKVTF